MSSVEATFNFTVSHPSSLIGPSVLTSAAMTLYSYVIVTGLNTVLGCLGNLVVLTSWTRMRANALPMPEFAPVTTAVGIFK
jgi:hypothetical protein